MCGFVFRRLFFSQCRRVVASPIIWCCVFVFTAVLFVNSAIVFLNDNPSVIYAFDGFATLNLEAVVLSMLPSLPFALSYLDERRERSLRFSYVRCGVEPYIWAKYLAMLLSGFCVVILGSLIYCAILCIWMPLVGDYSGEGAIGMYAVWENGRPLLFLFWRIVCLGVSGALFTGLTFFFSLFFRGRYTVMVLPYLCYQMLSFLYSILKIDNLFFYPRYWLLETNPYMQTATGEVGAKVVFVAVILLVVGFVAVWKAERSMLRD